jgi:glucose/arabinose dehydrogenase
LFIGFWSLFPATAQAPKFRVEVVLPRAQFPVALAFSPDGHLFYTEKETGRVRVVSPDGELQREPVITFTVDPNVELGLLGIALDPEYSENGYIWVYYVQPNTIEPPYPTIKVVRFQEENGIGRDPLEMLSVPIVTRHQHHTGGNIHFDEDGYLYISIGDIGDETHSQDLNAMPGRIHRFAVEDDHLVIPPDNPYKDNSTFAYGLRNPFDFDFDPLSGDIIGGDNGPTCDDEINLIFAGGNYGWRPNYPCDDKSPLEAARYVYPLVYYTPPEAITGVLVYDGDMFPEWYGDVFFCGWNQGILRRMTLNEKRDRVAHIETVQLPNQTCSTDVEVAPDGSIYFTNYNSIYRIVAG